MYIYVHIYIYVSVCDLYAIYMCIIWIKPNTRFVFVFQINCSFSHFKVCVWLVTFGWIDTRVNNTWFLPPGSTVKGEPMGPELCHTPLQVSQLIL